MGKMLINSQQESFSLHPDTLRDIEIVSTVCGVTMQSFVQTAVTMALEHEKKRPVFQDALTKLIDDASMLREDAERLSDEE